MNCICCNDGVDDGDDDGDDDDDDDDDDYDIIRSTSIDQCQSHDLAQSALHKHVCRYLHCTAGEKKKKKENLRINITSFAP